VHDGGAPGRVAHPCAPAVPRKGESRSHSRARARARPGVQVARNGPGDGPVAERVVDKVENDAVPLPGPGRRPQAPPDLLDVEAAGVGRAEEEDGGDGGLVEALADHVHRREDERRAPRDARVDALPGGHGDGPVHVRRGNARVKEGGGEALRVRHVARKDDGATTRAVRAPARDRVRDGSRRGHSGRDSRVVNPVAVFAPAPVAAAAAALVVVVLVVVVATSAPRGPAGGRCPQLLLPTAAAPRGRGRGLELLRGPGEGRPDLLRAGAEREGRDEDGGGDEVRDGRPADEALKDAAELLLFAQADRGGCEAEDEGVAVGKGGRRGRGRGGGRGGGNGC
jgi:hypothetical protein